MSTTIIRFALASCLATAAALAASTAMAEEARIPVLVPITGFLSLEGTSQRNGALLALENPPQGVEVGYEVSDTATSPEQAVTALERALAPGGATAAVGSIFGTQMLAMLPIAQEYGVPMLTISGTAKLTEMGNDYVFRFFPTDAVVKVAQARYAVEELGRKRAAIVYQTTAYGQSGRSHLEANLQALGAEVVFQEGLAPAVKDMLPVLVKARAAKPDVLLIHLHSGPTALLIKQAAAMGLGLPIVAGSAMHQPSTAALLDPAELEDVCAESGSPPISGGAPALEQWVSDYRARFEGEPDAFALAQYDAVNMALGAVAAGASSAAEVRDALATTTYEGLAMNYKSDGTGNMAHDAVILCYDGETLTPRVVKRYENVSGAR